MRRSNTVNFSLRTANRDRHDISEKKNKFKRKTQKIFEQIWNEITMYVECVVNREREIHFEFVEQLECSILYS